MVTIAGAGNTLTGDSPFLLVGIGLLAVALFDLVTMGRWWQESVDEVPPGAAKGYPRFWRHWRRGRLTSDLVILVFALTGMVTVLTDAATGSIAPSFRWVVLALLGLVFLLDACVILFNRPRFLVPPSLRSEPGLIGGR